MTLTSQAISSDTSLPLENPCNKTTNQRLTVDRVAYTDGVESFGRRLKAAIEAEGLDQVSLAREIARKKGDTLKKWQTAVSKIVTDNKEASNPRYDRVEAVIRFGFGWTLGEFFSVTDALLDAENQERRTASDTDAQNLQAQEKDATVHAPFQNSSNILRARGSAHAPVEIPGGGDLAAFFDRLDTRLKKLDRLDDLQSINDEIAGRLADISLAATRLETAATRFAPPHDAGSAGTHRRHRAGKGGRKS